MSFRRIVLAVSVSAMLFAIPASAKAPPSGTTGSCPSSPSGFKTADNVGAASSNSGKITTYLFSSFTNEQQISPGVPGLIKYCVYPSGTKKNIPQPIAHTVAATGADGEAWLFVQKTTNFSFVRPDGNGSDIPLDGTTKTMGTATWENLPTTQTIILHINDPTECTSLYGAASPGTCFVNPGVNLLSCTSGDTTLAYNANPFGVIHCPKSAIGFEATATNEFGDEVQVAKDTTGTRLIVEFNSYGCGDSGHWFNTDCMTTPGETFTVPGGITATLYQGDDNTTGGQPAGTFIASSTITPNIPFRPSVDAACLPGTADVPGGWFDSLAPAGSECKNSESILLTFDFPGIDLTSGQKVVWTVQFNTSHSGYSPLLLQASPPPACPSQGCGYDSLNVGDQTYTNAPYAGTDIAVDIAFISFWPSGYPSLPLPPLPPLQSQTGWSDFRPLGEILQTP